MIIKLHRPGRSFAGVVRYLTHDRDKAKSSDRVAWTHTLNLANDHIPSAVDEMVWLARSADQLKRAASISTAGSKLERPVKHFSLSWHASESPTREEMIEVTQRYLKHMGMEGRQTILFAHNDTAHPHVHVVVNVVSPEDGRALKTSYEYRRTQAFALAYEREKGLVFCEERLKAPGEREKSMTRPAHESFRQAEAVFERDEARRAAKAPDYFARHDTKTMNGKEWEALKAFQKQQRETYRVVEGKQAFKALRNEVYKQVREEFRGQWNAYYAAWRAGGAPAELASMKAAIKEAQQKTLNERRDAACEKLKEQRDKDYEGILAQQRVDRHELTRQQERGLRTHRMFDVIYPAPEPEMAARPRKNGERTWQAGEVVPEARSISREFDFSAKRAVDPANKDPAERFAVPRTKDVQLPKAAPAKEISEAQFKALNKDRAREISDSERSKNQNEHHNAVRASWNRHRGSRGRGG